FSTTPERSERVLSILLEHGINHIDTAAGYGDSELHLAPWMKRHRRDFFLATKTGERTYDGAKRSIERSLERLEVESVDLLQLHNLVDEGEWRTALGPRGALEAALEARDQGLVRFLGVTGHGWDVARRHRESLERHPFDSVLLPYNFPMMSHPEYERDFESLLTICAERGVAVQTIKSVARRRWKERPEKRFSWYEPLRDELSVRAAVHYVLQRPGIFLNTSSDTTLLPAVLDAAGDSVVPRTNADMAAIASVTAMEPLFAPGQNAI
ncbi:MAG TPA: aldo/keto reductase, partial [Thermoanaerobaculia bacterium]|nr:aldo/keto reductase [Thermoanaerobaculia bacterium]